MTFLADVGGASMPSFGTSFFLVPPSLFLRCFSPFLLDPAPPFPPLLALLTCSSKKTLLRLSRPTGKITQIIDIIRQFKQAKKLLRPICSSLALQKLDLVENFAVTNFSTNSVPHCTIFQLWSSLGEKEAVTNV